MGWMLVEACTFGFPQVLAPSRKERVTDDQTKRRRMLNRLETMPKRLRCAVSRSGRRETAGRGPGSFGLVWLCSLPLTECRYGSRPNSRSTSAVCCPNAGAECGGSGGVPLNRSGEPGVRNRPKPGCSTSEKSGLLVEARSSSATNCFTVW